MRWLTSSSGLGLVALLAPTSAYRPRSSTTSASRCTRWRCTTPPSTTTWRSCEKGPENPCSVRAPRLAAIAEYTGNDYELLRVVGKIAPEAYPRQSRPLLHYLMGRKLLRDGDLADAAAHFDQVPTEHDALPAGPVLRRHHQLRAREAEERGEVVPRGHPRRAPSSPTASPSELEDLKDLALINIGRIYFGLERFDNAEQYYAKVERDSVLLAREPCSSAPGRASTRATTTKRSACCSRSTAPYFTDVEFIPETSYLRALTYWSPSASTRRSSGS
jgi:tetratricopeptide (TPR) repeat protein